MNPGIAIIGGGPAGIAAAVQLKRFDLNPCLFEQERLGGLLWNAQLVENYPGFYRGISGPQLAKRLKNHLDAYHINVIYEKVNQIDYDPVKETFSLATAESSYSAEIIVAASGTTAKHGGLPGMVPPGLNKNLFFEIVPILKKKKKKILIVGAGDIAFDYALNLSRHNEITLLFRGREIKALPLLVRRVRANPGICLLGPAVLQKIAKGKSKDLAVTFSPAPGAPRRGEPMKTFRSAREPLNCDAETSSHVNPAAPLSAIAEIHPLVAEAGPPVTLEFDYIVGAVGREPQMDYFSKGLMARQETLMSCGRFYFAGDVQNGRLRQAAIAAGNGIEAAMKIYRQIKEGLCI